MDHQFYVAWTITVCVLAGLFGALHLIAVISRIRKGFRPSYLVMLGGALGVLAAAVDCLLGGSFDWLLMAIGGGMVCGSAFWNGKAAAAESGDAGMFHLSHHLIRFGIAIILTMTFIRV